MNPSIWHLLLGGIAGWLAGKFMRGNGYGIIMDIILGLLGAWIGGYLAAKAGINLGGDIGYIVIAFLGAILLVWISRLVKARN